MATIISTKTSGVGGLTVTGDASGVLQLASADGTTAVTIDASQNVTLNNVIPSGSTAPTNGMFLPTTNTVGFSTANIERMRIDSSGNLLVGTTSSSTYYGNNRFASYTSASNTNAGLFATAWAGDLSFPAVYIGKYDNNQSTSQLFIRFLSNNSATATGQINGNGAGAVAFGGWSDRRLKENIKELPSQLSNITSLRPVEFDYIAGGHQIGFIAQEMQLIYPDVVGESDDGMLTVTGWSKTEARLVKAIQEQQTLIEALTARLTALEAK